MRNLIFDTHHLLHRTFFSILEDYDAETMTSLSFHKALTSMNKCYKQFMPDEVICVFDSPSWRKTYTSSDDCLTHKKYKGNRRKNLTEKQIIQYEIFDRHIQEFKAILKNKTGILVLEGESLEADDIIAGYVQNNETDTHIIVTSDNDFLQLLKYDTVTIFDPIKDKKKDLSEYDFDANYFMFQKCFRGDAGDNVMSAYPRIRSDKIKKAYTDDFILENLLHHKFDQEFFDESGQLVKREYRTVDVFNENLLLMDLEYQPEHIKRKITDCVTKTSRSRYNMIEFMRFCRKMDLTNIANSLTQFTDLLVGHK